MEWVAFTKNAYRIEEYCIPLEKDQDPKELFKTREVREGSVGGRALKALLAGKKGGVDVGLFIIPDILAICTIVMMLTNEPSDTGAYTGAAGAAIGLVPNMVETGIAGANDIAVFTAMCMCWSGYLSTHVAMMSSLDASKLTEKAIFSHTIGGLCAGVIANWLFKLVMLIL